LSTTAKLIIAAYYAAAKVMPTSTAAQTAAAKASGRRTISRKTSTAFSSEVQRLIGRMRRPSSFICRSTSRKPASRGQAARPS
jgi:hypothetical protein